VAGDDDADSYDEDEGSGGEEKDKWRGHVVYEDYERLVQLCCTYSSSHFVMFVQDC